MYFFSLGSNKQENSTKKSKTENHVTLKFEYFLNYFQRNLPFQ